MGDESPEWSVHPFVYFVVAPFRLKILGNVDDVELEGRVGGRVGDLEHAAGE